MRGRYTRNDMQSWADSLVQLPISIKTLQDTVKDDEAILAAQRKQLADLKRDQINPTRLLYDKLAAKIELPTLAPKIASLENEVIVLSRQADALTLSLKQTFNEINPINDKIQYIKTLIRLKSIQSSLVQLARENSELLIQFDEYQRKLVSEKNSLAHVQALVNSYRSRLDELECRKRQLEITFERERQFSYDMAPVTVTNPIFDMSTVTVNAGLNVMGMNLDYSFHMPQPSVSLTPVIVDNDSRYNISELERQIEVCRNELRQQDQKLSSTQYDIRKTEDKMNDILSTVRYKEHEIRSLESKRDRYSGSDRDAAYNTDNENLDRMLSDQKKLLLPLENQRNQLEMSKNNLDNQAEKRKYEAMQLQKRLVECEKLVTDFIPLADISFEAQLSAAKVSLANFEQNQNEYESGIRTLESKIATALSLIESQTNLLSENRANEFLALLSNSPEKLLEKLESEIYLAIRQFEIEHPINQSIATRTVIAELQYKIPQLKLDSAVATAADKSAVRDCYFLVCGLVADLVNKAENMNQKLANKLTFLLDTHKINLTFAKSEYSNFKATRSTLNDLLVIDLLAHERQQFASAKNSFVAQLALIRPTMLAELNDVKATAEQMLACIDLKMKAAESSRTEFDYKYYMGMLNLSSQLMMKTNDHHLREAFRAHISHLPTEIGAQAAKISGICLMFLGAVIAAVAAVVAVLGFPIGAPLYFSAPVAGAGVAMILGGVGLFRYGVSKDLPSKSHSFIDLIDEHQHLQMADSVTSEDVPLKGPGSYNVAYNVEPSAPLMDM